jgi:peroxiredoxin
MKTTNTLTGLLLGTLAFSPLATLADDTTLPNYDEQRQQYMGKRTQGANKGGKFSAEDRAVMKSSADKLARALPEPGLKVGTKAPDFTLTNAFGKAVTLSDELNKGPVILVFYRGAWCPFCNMHLHVLHKSLPAFKQHGAQLIAVTPQTPDKSAAQITRDNYPFEVLSDLDSAVMKAYQLYYELDPELVKVYRKHSLDVEEFNGPGRNVLPIPGTFIIDSKGIIRGMHADTDYKERMEPAEILGVLQIFQ